MTTEDIPATIIGHVPGFVWMPVRTKPRREKKVAEFCAANNILCYLPLRKSVRRYERRTVTFNIPMFPSYIFCNLNEAKFQRLLHSNAILFKIKLDERDEEKLIEELRAVRALETISAETDVAVKPELVKGTKVLIQTGVMKGLQGIIERRKGKALISVNIELLGQSVSAEVDVEDVALDED